MLSSYPCQQSVPSGRSIPLQAVPQLPLFHAWKECPLPHNQSQSFSLQAVQILLYTASPASESLRLWHLKPQKLRHMPWPRHFRLDLIPKVSSPPFLPSSIHGFWKNNPPDRHIPGTRRTGGRYWQDNPFLLLPSWYTRKDGDILG